ncbi:DUF192 domain-containing protein [Candidatus Saccharibacteria bacterium]|nr:DUF192 domain-containing protein [Candidatus Saccharibacteria bacterium]
MPKQLRLVVVAVLVIAAVVAAVLFSGQDNVSMPKQVCGPYRNDKAVQIGSTQIKTEVASADAERAKGLGGRPCIESDRGMLFVFDKPGRYPFWMKDMRFPIDIVWISPNHRVVGLEVDVLPSSFPDRFVNKDEPAQYVLELQANRAKDLKIGLGTPVDLGL